MKKQIIIGIGIIALIISFIFDKSILIPVYSIRFSALTAVMKIITNLWFIIALIGAISIIIYKKRRFILLWLACLSSLAFTLILKLIIPRARPLIMPLIVLADSSFPSAHAGVLFAALPVICRYKPKLKYIWLAVILLIAFSRLYLGVHYLSDIIAGALTGYIIGMVIIWLNQKYKFLE